MAIEKIFARISPSGNDLTIKDAVERIVATGRFGMLSFITESLARSEIEDTLKRIDTHEGGNRDGRMSLNEFKEALRYYLELIRPALQGLGVDALATAPTAWAELPRSGKGWIDVHDVLARIDQEVEKELPIGSSAVSTESLAQMVVALLDPDGDGKVYRAEYEALLKEIEDVPTPWRPK